MYPELSRRRLFQAGALALAGSPFLAACGSDSGASAGAGAEGFGEIAVQLSWIKNIEFAGEYMATANGYYEQAGFSKVELLAGGASGTTAESALATGKAFVGLSTPTVTAPAITKGAPLKIVGTTYQKNPFCIVSIDKSPIATPADMAGKKIGVQSGANTVIFAALLAANGMTEDDVEIVPVQFDPMVVTTGEVDGFMSYITNEPILLDSRGFDVTTFLLADNGLPLVAETFTVLQSSIDDERDKVKAFLKAEIQGWADAVASPEKSAELAVNTFGKDQGLKLEEQVKEAQAQNDLVVSDDTKANGLFTISPELIEANLRALELAGTPITAEKLFDLTLLDEVYAENPDLK
ncbi:ABC transporter substrate-binding protein [Kineosporia succinea]|uniref:ABC-type nitrate/sulfonate/bicarbonate transport system substrate-binding protein n=1 Tax=Kineosporia succinea TaxID=84632 RepID=A0ABT9NV13_9ACTN|nr:ABC transporter substrate-binding protein [Kineosporia succinea]MDP9824273.1 ABC-type nitrate/sulfonate/bicarbonate transport system substrate-binding protein [Kineosporia succinea]